MLELNNLLTKVKSSCLIWILLALLVIGLDLTTKYIASVYLAYAQPVALLSFLDLTLLHNPGAAFSFLAAAGGWQRWFFISIAVIFSIVLVIWMSRTPKQFWWVGMALALVLGGAVGNLYDRLLHGYVIDFISIHYGGWYFPAFNIADSAITLGAVLLIIDGLFLADKTQSANN